MDTDPARLEIALLRAARSVRRAFDARLRGLDLNMTEVSLLSFLRDRGSLTQRELADHLHIGRASVGSFVDGLEQRGLVRRTDDPNDGRAWRVTLREASRRLVDAFDVVDAELRAEIRAGLTRDERQLLAELLIRVERNAAAAASDALVPPTRPVS